MLHGVPLSSDQQSCSWSKMMRSQVAVTAEAAVGVRDYGEGPDDDRSVGGIGKCMNGNGNRTLTRGRWARSPFGSPVPAVMNHRLAVANYRLAVANY
jgi:hypothetical protein